MIKQDHIKPVQFTSIVKIHGWLKSHTVNAVDSKSQIPGTPLFTKSLDVRRVNRRHQNLPTAAAAAYDGCRTSTSAPLRWVTKQHANSRWRVCLTVKNKRDYSGDCKQWMMSRWRLFLHGHVCLMTSLRLHCSSADHTQRRPPTAVVHRKPFRRAYVKHRGSNLLRILGPAGNSLKNLTITEVS